MAATKKNKKSGAKISRSKTGSAKPAARAKPTTKRAVAKKKPAAKKKKPAARKPAPKKKPAARKPAAKKSAAKKKPVSKTKRPSAKAAARRDRPGHIRTDYARDLLAKSGGPDRDDASSGFVSGAHSDDDLAERLGEETLEEATSGENEGEDILDEERGGPFVETDAKEEFGYEPDASNPVESVREPFPRT
jgi:hypothetical protein